MSGIFAPELWPFTLAVVVLLGLAAAELVALLAGTSFLHWHGDFAEQADDVPDGALGWLHFGKVPLLVILVIFLTGFALAGFVVQFAAHAGTGLFLPVLLAAAPAFVLAVLGVRVLGGVIGRIIPRDETTAVSDASLVGRIGNVVIGTARAGTPAQARVRDEHGASHYVMVEPEAPDQVLESGASILLVRHLSGRRFHAIPNPKPELL